MWECGPRTKVKLQILDTYLGAWFNILKSNFSRVVYLDTFCGPGMYTTGEDGSPIVALKQAEKASVGFPNFRPEFIFIDNDEKHLDNLKGLEEFKRLSSKFRVHTFNGDFLEVIDEALGRVSINQNTPLFSFVDPFNVKVIPFASIGKLMKYNERSELFVNFFGGTANRCYNHPVRSTAEQVAHVLGKVIDIPDGEEDRLKVIFDAYQGQLGTLAPFVRKFQFRDETNVRDNALYFVCNHKLGLQRMKEAMWKIDPINGQNFSEHRQATTGSALDLFSEQPNVGPLKKLLLIKFPKETKVKMSNIDSWVESETEYLTKHLRKTGGLMETLYNEGKIKYFDKEEKKKAKNNWPQRLLIDFL